MSATNSDVLRSMKPIPNSTKPGEMKKIPNASPTTPKFEKIPNFTPPHEFSNAPYSMAAKSKQPVKKDLVEK